MSRTFSVKANNVVSKVQLDEHKFSVAYVKNEEEQTTASTTDVTIFIDEIIAIKDSKSSSVDNEASSSCSSFVVHYIKRDNAPVWTKDGVTFTPKDDNEDQLQAFLSDLNEPFKEETAKRPKKIVVLMNPIGGKRQAKNVYEKIMAPLFELTGISAELIVSQHSKHLIEVITEYDYKSVDGIVLMGGDGTFGEILNVLMQRVQKEAEVDKDDPKAKLVPIPTPICIVPTGTGNGAAEAIAGCKDELTTILHLIRGKTKFARILANYSGNQLIGYSSCIFGALLASEMVDMADNKLRWMRAARYLAIPLWMLFRKQRTVPVEITLYSHETKLVEEDGQQVEKSVEKTETVSKNCCMSMIWPWEIVNTSGKYGINPSNDGGGLHGVIYEPMGKMTFFKHFMDLSSRKQNMFDYPSITEYKGHAIRFKMLEKNGKPPESDIRNLKLSVDGEMYTAAKADYFIRVLPDVVRVFTTY